MLTEAGKAVFALALCLMWTLRSLSAERGAEAWFKRGGLADIESRREQSIRVNMPGVTGFMCIPAASLHVVDSCSSGTGGRFRAMKTQIPLHIPHKGMVGIV